MTEITALIREHEAPLIRYATRILKDHQAALDAVQETFIKLVRISQEGRRDSLENIKSWLYKVTRNHCFDELKSGKRKFEVQTDLGTLPESIAADKIDAPDSAAEKEDAMMKIREIMNQLKPVEKEVIVLKLEHGKSYKEIADITKLTVGNVGFILHHALRKVKEGMARQESLT